MTDWQERLTAALAKHGVTLTRATPLHGGACQDNYRVEVAKAGGSEVLALRSDAKQALPGSIDRSSEFAVINAAVAAGVKTPAAKWLGRDVVRDGAHAYFMQWVAGEAIGRRVVRNPELAAARERLPIELAENLARIHSITPSKRLPLTPARGSPARAAIEFSYALLDALPAPYPAVELALRWLERHRPTEEDVVLVHGDFRTGNFMVGPDGLTAVLDWEFAHWGSPFEDLGWLSVRDWRFGQLDKPIGGFAQREPFYRAYAEYSGRTVNLEHVHWWEVFGNVRWAIGSVAQGERYLSGQERDLELIAIARRSTEMEHEALRLIKKGSL